MIRLAYIGIGSNLADPARQIEHALRELSRWGPLRRSSLYRTEPLGDSNQPWYVNAVAELSTERTPVDLLSRLKRMERRAGRTQGGPRWGPRILDLDLLLVGELIVRTPELELPHPGLQERRFVLRPLAELAPAARDPRDGRSAAELLATLDDPLRVEKLPRTPARKSGKLGSLEVQQP